MASSCSTIAYGDITSFSDLGDGSFSGSLDELTLISSMSISSHNGSSSSSTGVS
jgi:hypothetical protein